LIARTPKMYSEGDLLFGFSGGGPGYGDPLERKAEDVVEDLKKKIVSEWTASQVYKVALHPESRKLDATGTEELRDAERQARLARGQSYDDFMAEWTKLSPPQDILQYYGTWPDAKSTGPVFRP